jgi:hypothetical protein
MRSHRACAEEGAGGCVIRATSVELGARRTAQVELGGGGVRCRNYWGDIHAQHSFLSHPGGRACDRWYFDFEGWRHADRRDGHKTGGGFLIVCRADAMEEMAARAHEMLPRIRHRPLQLSLVSALTR